MPIQLHAYSTAERDNFLKIKENNDVNKGWTRPYVDGSIAIGYGFDLLTKVNVINKKDEITPWLNKTNDALGLTGSARVTLSASDFALLGSAKGASLTKMNEVKAKLQLKFPSEAYAAKLLTIMLDAYSTALDAALGFNMDAFYGLSSGTSKEKTAILSVLYNITQPTASKISDKFPALLDAIKNRNRAEAWYEIRYRSNSEKTSAVARRRYAEAQLFGLYNNESAISEADAKEVMRMFTLHEIYEENIDKKMSTYESQRGLSAGVSPIAQEVQRAQNYLIANFARGTAIDGWVIVGRGLETYQYKEGNNFNEHYIGCNKNDLMFGEKGDDILEGGEGNDVIYGGEGRDHLYGGAGVDTLIGGSGGDAYFFKESELGAGGCIVDTIDDDGNGDVIVYLSEQGSVIKTSYLGGNYCKQEDGSWIKAIGEKIYRFIINSGTGVATIMLPNNAGAVELKDFQSGDFGINLIDTPAAPVTTVGILGDGTGEHCYDANGHLINITLNPQPGQHDLLYDGVANDRIEAMGGNDLIHAQMGGDDWLLGGAGNDVIASQNFGGAASDKDIIEGGAGSDMLWGGPDSDKVFAENYGEMETLIAAGEVATAEAGKGELLNGAEGNDFVYGSNRADALFGGDGHDLLVGGGGADVIYGDNDGTSIFNWDSENGGASSNWSFSITPTSVVLNDISIVESTAPGDDTIYAGSGNDEIFDARNIERIVLRKHRQQMEVVLCG